MSSVTCQTCGSESVGSTVHSAYFAQQKLHKDGCGVLQTKGFDYEDTEGDLKFTGSLNRYGARI